MDLLKIIIKTPERGPLLTQRWLFQIVQTQSQRINQPVTAIKIKPIWPESYLIKEKKKL